MNDGPPSHTSDRNATPRLIDGLGVVAGEYQALLVDVWGVLHNGRDRYGAAEAACRAFRNVHGPVVLISNSPRRSAQVERQLAELGFAADFYDGVVTSGEVTRRELAARAPGPVYPIGPDRDAHIYDGLGLSFAASPQEAAFLSCTGLFDDRAETPEDYTSLLAEAQARGLEMVCANPDIVVNHGGTLIYCAGALAQRYEQMGARVVMAGKPHIPIYEAAFALLQTAAGGAVAPEAVLAIGDGPHTDLAGAAACGADALFIAGGVHAQALSSGRAFTAEAAAAILAEYGHPARYAAPALSW